MARRRFFVDAVDQGTAVLRGEDASHLARVLRAETGQRYEISDNRSVYLAEIAEARKDRITFRVLEPLAATPAVSGITLLAALIKFDRFEWIVEKATELGVDAIVPVEAARSEKGLLEAARKRVDRWRRIARESSQQSRRDRLPEIRDPQRLPAGIAAAPGARFFLEELPGAPALMSAPVPLLPEPLSLLVGPEGGWTGDERALFLNAAWAPVSLGSQILRAETAALAAVVLVVHLRFAPLPLK
jgi:16S rRNA (uracil1498-N3)-methyltransferase